MIIKKILLFFGFTPLLIVLYTEISFNNNIGKNQSFIYADSSQTQNNDSIHTLDTLLLGKQLYENKCQTCHPLFEPKDFTSKDWKKILTVMSVKSKLTQNEYVMISKYLTRFSKK